MCQDTHRLSEPAEADPLLEKGLALLSPLAMFQVPHGHRLDVRGVTVPVPVPPRGAPSPRPSTMRQVQGTATRCSILFQAGRCLSAAHCFNPGFLQHGQHPVPTTPVLPEVPLC